MKLVFLAVLLTCFGCLRSDPQMGVTWLEAPPASIEFGQPFDVELSWRWPASGEQLELAPTVLPPFELEQIQEERRAGKTQRSVKRRLRLRGFHVGTHQIRVPFAFVDAQGNPVQSDARAAIEVRSSLTDTMAEGMDRPPLLGLGLEDPTFRWVQFLSFLLAIGVTTLLFRTMRRARHATRELGSTPWRRFEALLELPRDTREDQLQLALAIREALRDLTEGRAWSGEELEQKLNAEFALQDLEQASLQRLLAATEEACFAASATPPLSPDALLDLYAEVLGAVTAKQEEGSA